MVVRARVAQSMSVNNENRVMVLQSVGAGSALLFATWEKIQSGKKMRFVGLRFLAPY